MSNQQAKLPPPRTDQGLTPNESTGVTEDVLERPAMLLVTTHGHDQDHLRTMARVIGLQAMQFGLRTN